MNILMLGWEMPPHNSGGLGVACYNLSKAMSTQGAEIDFVVPYEAEHPDIDFMNVHSAVPVSPLERFGMGAYDSHFVSNIISKKKATSSKNIRDIQAQYIKFIEDRVKHKKPDIIHANDWLTMEAGVKAKELTNAPLVVHVHATEFDRSGEHYGNPLVHQIEKQGLLMADRIIAVSKSTKNIIVDRYKIPADKIEVIHNAFDPSEMPAYDYSQNSYRYLEHLKSSGHLILGTITRLTVQKGLTHLIRALAKAVEKNPKIALLLAGDGEQRDELISLAAEYGVSDKIFFTGFVRGKRWRDAYGICDVFVMSSVSEPFGLTALEAAHHDCALIITNQSGVGEVLSSVLRYDFWDINKLADEIVSLAQSPALLSSLQRDIKKEYAQISWADVASRCNELYKTSLRFKKMEGKK